MSVLRRLSVTGMSLAIWVTGLGGGTTWLAKAITVLASQIRSSWLMDRLKTINKKSDLWWALKGAGPLWTQIDVDAVPCQKNFVNPRFPLYETQEYKSPPT
ncbi:hypothetical protein CEK25_002415 [Fusarium fujikuroi]|nr:hypothetical protein CEK25_002415 [Fusarium fujikuroi]